MAAACANQEPEFEYKVGDLISSHDPFVKCLSVEFVESHCYRCFEPNATLPCPHCNAVNYCQADCLTTDYIESHYTECHFWKQAPDYRRLCFANPFDAADKKLFLLRLFALLQQQPHLKEKEYPSRSRFPTFNDLLRRVGTHLKSPELESDCRVMAAYINVAKGNIVISFEALLQLASVIQSVKVGIMNPSHSIRIGWGVYVTPFFPHSCKPTVNLLTQGTKLQVRAIANIPEGQGRLRISYLKDHMAFLERKQYLMYLYKDQCFCQRCQVGYEDKVNFGRLKLLLKQRDEIRQAPHIEGCSWNQIYATHLEILDMFRIMYEEYDITITDFFCNTVSIGVMLGVEKSQMKELFSDTTDRVAKTYGREHAKYRSLEATIGEYFN